MAAFVGLSGGPLVSARAQNDQGRRVPPLLLGGAIQPEKSPVLLDPVLPRGALRTWAAPKNLLKEARCSLERPVCVHWPRSTEELAAGALKDLERAFEEQVWGLRLPSNAISWRHPLVWDLQNGPVEVTARVERIPSRSFDVGRAWCEGGLASLSGARVCVAAALTAARAPATAPWLRDGYAAALARELGEAPATGAAMVASWSRPEIGVLTNTSRVDALQGRGELFISLLRSARFFDYIEHRSRDDLGHAGFYALTLAGTRTPAGSPRWDAEPDLFDVLSVTLRGDRIEIARLMDDFAQYSFARANSDAVWLVPDWIVSAESLPRSVAFSRPVEPTGSIYLRLEVPESMSRLTYGFRTSCEAPVSYVWSVARLDDMGEEISRFPITFRQRGGDASGRVLPAENMRSLLLVGTNVGGVDLAHPFDPDHGPHESHGCRVAINVVPDEEQSGVDRD